MKSEFSTLDIVKALNIPRERLREWMNRGFVKPSIQEAEGQGTKALFNVDDLYRIELSRQLLESGFSRRIAFATVRAIKGTRLLNENYIYIGYFPEEFGGKKAEGRIQAIDIDSDNKEFTGNLQSLLKEYGDPADDFHEEQQALRDKASSWRVGALNWFIRGKVANKIRDLLFHSDFKRFSFVIILNLQKARQKVDAALGILE